MEALNKLAAYIQNASPKQFKQYLLMFLIGATCVAGLITYFIYQEKSELVRYTRQLHKLAEKSLTIIADNKKMVIEEQRLKELLDKNKDFTMKGFFEQFCREQNIIPEQGWDARVEQVNDKFDEIVLEATFKEQTTEKLTSLLEALEKKEIVYIKDLTLRNENNKKIGFDIALATKKTKSLWE